MFLIGLALVAIGAVGFRYSEGIKSKSAKSLLACGPLLGFALMLWAGVSTVSLLLVSQTAETPAMVNGNRILGMPRVQEARAATHEEPRADVAAAVAETQKMISGDSSIRFLYITQWLHNVQEKCRYLAGDEADRLSDVVLNTV